MVSGFIIRVLYGSAVADIDISGWLYLTVISVSFYMALGKRRNELKQMDQGTRKVLEFYNYEFLDKNMYMCMAIANIFYSLWAMDNGNRMLITVPVILLLSMRYSYDVEREESQGDPVDILLHDKMILFIASIYAVYMMIVLYSV